MVRRAAASAGAVAVAVSVVAAVGVAPRPSRWVLVQQVGVGDGPSGSGGSWDLDPSRAFDRLRSERREGSEMPRHSRGVVQRLPLILTTLAVFPHVLRMWMVWLEWTFSIDTPLTMTIWSLVLQSKQIHV